MPPQLCTAALPNPPIAICHLPDWTSTEVKFTLGSACWLPNLKVNLREKVLLSRSMNPGLLMDEFQTIYEASLILCIDGLR